MTKGIDEQYELIVDIDGVLHDTFKSVLDIMNEDLTKPIEYDNLDWGIKDISEIKDKTSIKVREKFDNVWRNNVDRLYNLDYVEIPILKVIEYYGNMDNWNVTLYSSNYQESDILNKIKLIEQLKSLGYMENISIIMSMYNKPAIKGDIVIEDTYENLTKYGNNTRKILIKRPWNKHHWNKKDVEILSLKDLNEVYSKKEKIMKSVAL